MLFDLMNKNNIVARFELVEEANPLSGVTPYVTKLCVIDHHVYSHLFWHMGILEFLKRRMVPANRAYMRAARSFLGFESLISYILTTHAVSMIDTLWVKDAQSVVKWEMVSPFDRPLDENVARYALTGKPVPSSLLEASSPEYSTDGMLPKMWAHDEEGIKLYKGGTEGAANAGMEPYAEFYASAVAERLHLHPSVRYDLGDFEGTVVSICKAFTNTDIAYVPMRQMFKLYDVPESQWEGFLDKMGLLEPFNDILLFDCVVCNPDRHLGNFGVLMDTTHYNIISMAPIFDNGMGMAYDWYTGNFEKLTAYQWVNRLHPCNLSGSFIEVARRVLDDRRRAALENLVDWTVPKHPKYNWAESKYTGMNELVQHQVKEILA